MARLALYNVIKKNPQEQLKVERQSGYKVNFTSSGQKDAIFPELTGIGQFKVHAKQGICLTLLLCMDFNKIQSVQETETKIRGGFLTSFE